MARISDGTRSFELRLIRCTFPPDDEPHVSTSLTTSVTVDEGSYTHPPVQASLTAQELRALITWLRKPMRSAGALANIGDPPFSFALAPVGGDHAELVILLSSQYGPRPASDREESFAYRILVTGEDLGRFADAIEAETHRFPPRRSPGFYHGRTLVFQSLGLDIRVMRYFLRDTLSLLSPMWLLLPAVAIPLYFVAVSMERSPLTVLIQLAAIAGVIVFAAHVARLRQQLHIDRRQVSLLGGLGVFAVIFGASIGALMIAGVPVSWR